MAYKRACMVSINNPTFNARGDHKHARFYLMSAMRKYLEDRDGCPVDLIVMRSRNNDFLEYTVDVNEWDPNKYDAVYIYNSTMNFFGGVPKIGSVIAYRKFADFTGDTYFIFTDPAPNMMITDPCANLKSKIHGFIDRREKLREKNGERVVTDDLIKEARLLTDDVIDRIDPLFKKMKVLSIGIDYNYLASKSRSRDVQKNMPVEMIDINKYEARMFFEERLKDNDYHFDDKEIDLVYFGNRRTDARRSIVSKYFNHKDINSLIIGFDAMADLDLSEGVHVNSLEYMDMANMHKYIDEKCFATIVIGDKHANGHAITYRLCEGLLLKCVGFVSIEYDPNKEMIKNEFLKDFIYVSSAEELHDKLQQIKSDKDLYEKLVRLEREEFENI